MTGDSRIRVMHVVDTLAPGGAERMAVDLVNLLDRDAFRPYLCTTRSDGALADAIRPDVARAGLARKTTWDLAAARAFAATVRREAIRVVHSHGRGSMRFVSFCRLAMGLRVRHVFHDHYGEIGRDTSARWDERACARVGFHAYVGVDSRLCDWAIRRLRLPAERVYLVRNGVDLGRFDGVVPVDLRAEFGLPRDRLLLAMLAHLRPQKDHATMLRALARSRHRARLSLVLIGTRWEATGDHARACKALAGELGLDGNLLPLGERTDVPAVLAGCDVGVLSSRSESGPLALIEYLASGLPYVVTRTGEVAEAVLESGGGRMVPVEDPVAFAAALDDLCDLSPEGRLELGRHGRQLARREFDQRATTARVEAVYRAVLAGRPAAAPRTSSP